MNQVYLCIPAKAILFGEYGVLYGGKAVAVTFFDHCFNISLKIKRLEENSSIKIKSDFFPNQNIQFSIHDNNENKSNDPNIFFFSNLIKPWNSYLENYELNIEIQKSFSPSLGFGSSSALIAGISAGLWQLIYQNKEYLNQIEFWNNIKQSIQNIQGGGSGYDVAVQLAAIENDETDKKTKFWIFQNKLNSIIPNIYPYIPNINLNSLGCFISTNIYSNTTKALHKFQNDKEKLVFANSHSKICESFLELKTIDDLQLIMKNSLEIARSQKILPLHNKKFNDLISIFNSKQISYKSMGAGHGDCLWVLLNKNKIKTECQISESDIPFAFETIGTENE
jgi:mevalonate kinase